MPHRECVVPFFVQILADQPTMALMWCCFRTQKAYFLERLRLECPFDLALGHQSAKLPCICVPACHCGAVGFQHLPRRRECRRVLVADAAQLGQEPCEVA